MYGLMAAELPELVRHEIAERRSHAQRYRLAEMLRRERKMKRR